MLPIVLHNNTQLDDLGYQGMNQNNPISYLQITSHTKNGNMTPYAAASPASQIDHPICR